MIKLVHLLAGILLCLQQKGWYCFQPGSLFVLSELSLKFGQKLENWYGLSRLRCCFLFYNVFLKPHTGYFYLVYKQMIRSKVDNSLPLQLR